MYTSRADYILSLYQDVQEERIKHDRTPEEKEKASERAARPPKNPYRSWGSRSAHGGKKDPSYRRRTAGKGKTAHSTKGKEDSGYEKPLSAKDQAIKDKQGSGRKRQNPTKAKNWAAKQRRKEAKRRRSLYDS